MLVFLFYIMKKKFIIIGAVLCSLITIVWVGGHFTGMLVSFTIPTPSNMPNIKPGDRVFASNLKDPRPYNFIVFTSSLADSLSMAGLPEITTGSRYLHRLCGVPGDVIEMKNGTFFVNNRNFDTILNLCRSYKITNTEFYSIEQDDIIACEAVGMTQMISNDTGVVTFDNALLKKYASKIKAVPYLMAASQQNTFQWNNKKDEWTTDNFGPLKIPANCYFVLGDNRHNALDSRYIGFVKKEDIKGVALNK